MTLTNRIPYNQIDLELTHLFKFPRRSGLSHYLDCSIKPLKPEGGTALHVGMLSNETEQIKRYLTHTFAHKF